MQYSKSIKLTGLKIGACNQFLKAPCMNTSICMHVFSGNEYCEVHILSHLCRRYVTELIRSRHKLPMMNREGNV